LFGCRGRRRICVCGIFDCGREKIKAKIQHNSAQTDNVTAGIFVILYRKGGEMQVSNKIHGNVLYIMLNGELDENTAEYTRISMEKCMDSISAAQIVIDLANLRFMDSTGIGVLIGRYKKMQNKGIPIYIANPSAQAERIFKMTGLYKIMPKVGNAS
jgi:stage II sporulation protein AA (anti-sigma F factor antagonist)